MVPEECLQSQRAAVCQHSHILGIRLGTDWKCSTTATEGGTVLSMVDYTICDGLSGAFDLMIFDKNDFGPVVGKMANRKYGVGRDW